MAVLRRLRLLPVAVLALVVASASAADPIVDFSFYPEKAQDCLYSAATSSQCESKTVDATNSCFCRNGGDFITTAATCIGKSAPGAVSKTYDTMSDACKLSQTPITITKQEFVRAANGPSPTATATTSSASSTSTTQSSTSTSASATTTDPVPTTSQPPSEDKGDGGALSTGVMVGIIVGVIGGLAMLGAAVYLFFRRRKKLGEESHPMLPQHQNQHGQQHQAHNSMAPSGHDSTASAYYSSPPTTAGWPKKDWSTSPDLRVSGRTSDFNWESASQLAYPGSAVTSSPPPLPVQELDASEPLPGSTAAPVEMGGTLVASAPPVPNTQYIQPYNPSGQQYPAPGWGQQGRE
ncbi:hypothetical protein B0J18DRAFT_36681 [Chaetomium sp. MPI-SDFR-AT-0129]|nr:hypothetical protein B0J18DRAFT_36681 [Chaetomium sp. MPI-SDFR-AT-0129]